MMWHGPEAGRDEKTYQKGEFGFRFSSGDA
jgi:hypothetical protein